MQLFACGVWSTPSPHDGPGGVWLHGSCDSARQSEEAVVWTAAAPAHTRKGCRQVPHCSLPNCLLSHMTLPPHLADPLTSNLWLNWSVCSRMYRVIRFSNQTQVGLRLRINTFKTIVWFSINVNKSILTLDLSYLYFGVPYCKIFRILFSKQIRLSFVLKISPNYKWTSIVNLNCTVA